MQHLSFLITASFSALTLLSCSGHKTTQQTIDSSKKNSLNPEQQIIDAAKLKSDLNDLQNVSTGGFTDTSKLKKTAADILTTDADVLSDSGISKIGNRNDPAAKEAQNTLIKMRNALGITPDKLDSMRKAAASLSAGTEKK